MARDTHNERSGYEKGATLGEIAARYVARLADQTETNEETAYGWSERRAETFTLAGGGPGADVTFILDGEDVVEAFVNYYEMSGIATVYMRRDEAQDAYDNLRQPVEDDDETDGEG